MQCLEEAEQQAEAIVDVPYPPLQIVNSVPFLSTPFLNPLSSPFLHPFLLFWSILCPPKIKTSSFITFCFTNGTYFCIVFHTMTLMHSISLWKPNLLQFVIPWGLEETMATSQGRIKKILIQKGDALRPSSSSNCLFVSFSFLSFSIFLCSLSQSSLLSLSSFP